MSGFGYNAEYYDAATGMINLRARQYEPMTMRFSQEDIIRDSVVNPISLNRYLYCQNNPISFSDPTGMLVFNKLGNAVKSAAEAVKSTVKAAASKTVSTAAKVTAKVANTVSKVSTTVSKVSSTVSNVASNVSKAASFAKTTVSNEINKTKVSLAETDKTAKIQVGYATCVISNAEENDERYDSIRFINTVAAINFSEVVKKVAIWLINNFQTRMVGFNFYWTEFNGYQFESKSKSYAISYSLNGDVGLIITESSGAGIPNFGMAFIETVSTAKNNDELLGMANSIGGGIGYYGVEFAKAEYKELYSNENMPSEQIYSITGSVGVSISPIDLYKREAMAVNAEEKLFQKYNIFEIIDEIFERETDEQ